MPITYHLRSRSPDSADDLLSSPDQESFHDDSVVLSDLIRTGEHSRLRRRGAMRIEAAGTSSSSRYRRMRSPRHSDTHVDPSPHTWTLVESRSRRIPRHLPMLEVSDDDLELGDSDSDSGDEMVFSASFNRAISEQTGQLMLNRPNSSRARIASEPDGEKSPAESSSYTLVCGGPLEIAGLQSGAESIGSSAFASFILPELPQSSPSLSPRSSPANGTNGCGAALHARVFPRYRQHQPMWTANTPATEAVVPLERVYFDDICARERLSPKVIRQEACGCLRIGIGCAYCGNPLGFRLTPCGIMRKFVSSRRSTLTEPRHASKPGYDDADLHLYTFFCSSTTSPERFSFPSVERAPSGRGDTSRSRNHPLLPPPPPLIRLTSDTESDTDEEVIIDFRAPGSSSIPSTVLGGDLTASPEPTVLNLEPNPPPLVPPLPSSPPGNPTESAEQFSELEEALAGWASVVRGVGVTASSPGEDSADNSSQSPNISAFPRSRAPERRNALGFDAEGELGFSFTRINEPRDLSLNRDVSSVLFEDTSSFPQPEIEGSTSSTPTLEPNDVDQTTPRASVWDMSFEDGHPSTSFWGRPTTGGQWTWGSESAEAERERDREGNDQPVRVFDPDGEFLEGLDGEWGEDMARRLGFDTQEEKNDGNETPTTSGFWWS